MVIHVKDAETDMLIRKLAKQRNISITAAIKHAAREALGQDREARSLWAETADIRSLLARYERTGLTADKTFFDELSGQGDDDDVR